MNKNTTIFTVGTVGCIVMAIVYAVIALFGMVDGVFPLGYAVEAFTTRDIGAVILFLAAAAEIVTVVITRIVYNAMDKVALISRGTTFTGMAFIALIFVFQQSIIPIALWLVGAGISVATLYACSDIVKPTKVEEKK